MSSEDAITVEPMVFSRELDAPMTLVFDVWTQADHLKNWQFPRKGFVCDYVVADIETGGSSLHKMVAPEGFEMWLLTKYHEVTPPDTIVFTQYNSNENGDILPNPQMPNWPKEIRATVTLKDEGGKTKMDFSWQPIDPTKEEAEAFNAARTQLGSGWGSGFDQLEAYLGSL